jgi:hypothetical protein
MNRHGCVLKEDAAQRAASKIVSKVSSGISSPLKARGDHLSRKIESMG